MQIVASRPCSATVHASEPLVALSVLHEDLRKPANRACYDGLVNSVITVLNERLSEGNTSVVTTISERNRKMRQLFFALLGVAALSLLLVEAGFAIYYATHTQAFCNYESGVNNAVAKRPAM